MRRKLARWLRFTFTGASHVAIHHQCNRHCYHNPNPQRDLWLDLAEALILAVWIASIAILAQAWF